MAKNTGIAQFAQGKQDVFKVDPRLLVINADDDFREMNAELEDHIDMLAKSIAEIGVKKPIEVKLNRDGKLIVMEGRCRTRAAMRAIEVYNAPLQAVPVISVDRHANDADLLLNQFIGNQGKSFAPIEQARIFKKLLEMGWNQTDIAKKTGLSNGRVSQLVELLAMPAQVQAVVASGNVSASLAQSVVKAAATPEEAQKALQEAVNKAAEAGRSKVKPGDVPTVNIEKQPTNLKAFFKEIFDNSDIDNSADETDKGVVFITMKLDDFEKVRKLLEL